jgi:hypothetical protein
VLSGDDILEIAGTHYLHRGPITLSGNAKLIITDSVFEHVKDFSFEHELKATENSEVIVQNSGIGTSCTGSFNWAFFDNSKLTVNGMDPTFSQCNTWNFMSGSSLIDSVVGVDPSGLEDPPNGGNVYARGNGQVILRNTTVYGEQITQDSGEIVVE